MQPDHTSSHFILHADVTDAATGGVLTRRMDFVNGNIINTASNEAEVLALDFHVTLRDIVLGGATRMKNGIAETEDTSRAARIDSSPVDA